jgi:hypothetical protein
MNFFGLINFETSISPKALCPLTEPLPPDSVGAARVEAAGLTTELTPRFLEGEGGSIKKKKRQNKFKTSEK